MPDYSAQRTVCLPCNRALWAVSGHAHAKFLVLQVGVFPAFASASARRHWSSEELQGLRTPLRKTRRVAHMWRESGGRLTRASRPGEAPCHAGGLSVLRCRSRHLVAAMDRPCRPALSAAEKTCGDLALAQRLVPEGRNGGASQDERFGQMQFCHGYRMLGADGGRRIQATGDVVEEVPWTDFILDRARWGSRGELLAAPQVPPGVFWLRRNWRFCDAIGLHWMCTTSGMRVPASRSHTCGPRFSRASEFPRPCELHASAYPRTDLPADGPTDASTDGQVDRPTGRLVAPPASIHRPIGDPDALHRPVGRPTGGPSSSRIVRPINRPPRPTAPFPRTAGPIDRSGARAALAVQRAACAVGWSSPRGHRTTSRTCPTRHPASGPNGASAVRRSDRPAHWLRAPPELMLEGFLW